MLLVRGVDTYMPGNQAFRPLSTSQRQFLIALNSKCVEYLVTGSHAGQWYGVRRVPHDLDIVIEREAGNIDRLVDALSAFPGVSPDLLRTKFLEPDKAFHWEDIEVSNGVPNLSVTELFLERTLVKVDGLNIPIISKELLIQSKKDALSDSNRPQAKRELDRDDLAILLGTQHCTKYGG